MGPSEVFAKHQNVPQDHFVLELHMAGLNQTPAAASSDAWAQPLPQESSGAV